MSGKAPPRGPRALLGPSGSSSGVGVGSSSSIGTGTGATPPTGPRSLVNGGFKPLLNGHAHTYSRTPPAGPKGKGAAAGEPSWASSSRRPPAGPSALVHSQRASTSTSGASSSRPSTFFRQRSPSSSTAALSERRPPSPSASPPPPPPPADKYPTPPPPPPSSTPPPPPPPDVPHLFQPIKLRAATTQPSEPRLAPPPLPPLSQPAFPKSPKGAPPLLPPPPDQRDPRRAAGRAKSPSPDRDARMASPSPPPPPREPSPPVPEYVVVEKVVRDNGRTEKRYSLAPPPAWPPPRDEYVPGRSFRVLYDPACDTGAVAEGKARALVERLRASGPKGAERLRESARDKGKGRLPVVMRYEGEVVEGEEAPQASDSRKGVEKIKRPKYRPEFLCLSYEHDANSPGPPPPKTVLVFDFPPLLTSAALRRYFQKYGLIASFEREMDRATGAQLGVVSIAYQTHEAAQACVAGERGRNFAVSVGSGSVPVAAMLVGSEAAAALPTVVMDGEGKLLKLVLGHYEERKRREKERRRAQAQPHEAGTNVNETMTPAERSLQTPASGHHHHPPPPPNHTQNQAQSWRNNHQSVPPHPQQQQQQQQSQQQHPLPANPLTNLHPHLPPRPGGPLPYEARFSNGVNNNANASQRRAPPAALVRARAMNSVKADVPMHYSPASGSASGSALQGHLLPPEADLGSGSGRGAGARSHTPTPTHERGEYRRYDYNYRDRVPGHGRGAARYASGRAYNHHHRHYASARTPSDGTPRRSYSRSRSRSRSPSPVARRPGGGGRVALVRASAHANMVRELVYNGFEHVRIEEAQLSGGGAREEDVREFFAGFPVDRVMHDHEGWFITFKTADAARRAARVLSIGARTLANRSVTISVHPAPSSADASRSGEKASSLGRARERAGADGDDTRSWTTKELVAEAEGAIGAELRRLLEKDVLERVVGVQIRKMVAEERGRREAAASAAKVKSEAPAQTGHERPEGERRGLKGLSFRKRKTDTKVETVVPVEVEHEQEHEPESTPSVVTPVDAAKEAPSVTVATGEEDEEAERQESVERPRKRRRQIVARAVVRDRDLESEEEGEEEVQPPEPAEDIGVQDEEDVPPGSAKPKNAQRKRLPSPEPEPAEEPPAKRPKVDARLDEDADAGEPGGKSKKSAKKQYQQREQEQEKPKKGAKRGRKAQVVVEDVVIPAPAEIEPPTVVEVRVSPTPDRLRSPSPSAVEKPVVPVEHVKPLSESELRELVDDDEDLYLMKLALSLDVTDDDFTVPGVHLPPSDPDAPAPFRRHFTGSARTEGYYKISHAEKSAYVAQYASRVDTGAEQKTSAAAGPGAKAAATTPQPPAHVVSSRSNRANARRRAQGLEEINQLQLAVALSKGETGAAAADAVVKFNQLQTRKKHLRFARSPIHDWGLYAMERIIRGEMVIEYVGEVIRAAVADKREKAYERQGIGSSYLFRIDEDLVVDATKKGNLGRLINHSCDPNCTAKIITINGEKKIVIYAKQDIELGDEITYDYHFPFEQDKIPCLCGSAKCRGFLN